MLPSYPEFREIPLDSKAEIDGLIAGFKHGISDFTFANIYLYRDKYAYTASRFGSSGLIIAGMDEKGPGFMLPAALPDEALLAELFDRFSTLYCVSEERARVISSRGHETVEDRDNFDYLYLRSELATLAGRKFHGKKNFVNSFLANFTARVEALFSGNKADAVLTLEKWRASRAMAEEGDYAAAKEAIVDFERLGLTGSVYYIGDEPVAFVIGEELVPDTFVIHFEKCVDGYRGLFQYVGFSFASALAKDYVYVNREQDLGIEGLRKSKTSLKPAGFVKKYRVTRP